jgi:ribosome-associated toxin RatA of RatAB toxin-antitoxin module
MTAIVDAIEVAAPIDKVFEPVSNVERWPALLPHYRWVKMLERQGPLEGVVEMAAYRPFGPLNYPTWWVSKMEVDPPRHEVRYQHIRGITKGMDVVWRLSATPTGTHIDLVHAWDGPDWPVIRQPAARWVILPIFVHGIASLTLAGIKRFAELGV